MRIIKSAIRTTAFILAALAGITLLSACGQKGPLKLPPALPPASPPASPPTLPPTPEKAAAMPELIKAKDSK